jgi:nucleotide-binding universal stress UspA family protein
MSEKIVIGLDGSAGSARALRWVVARASGDGSSEVIVVHAIRPMGEFFLDLPMTGLDHWRENLRWQLETEWCKPLADAGLRYRAVTVEDKAPAVALTEAADAEAADLIVVGAQGHGGVGDRLLGNVSYKLAHTAHEPVVIVPADWSSA